MWGYIWTPACVYSVQVPRCTPGAGAFKPLLPTIPVLYLALVETRLDILLTRHLDMICPLSTTRTTLLFLPLP